MKLPTLHGRKICFQTNFRTNEKFLNEDFLFPLRNFLPKTNVLTSAKKKINIQHKHLNKPVDQILY